MAIELLAILARATVVLSSAAVVALVLRTPLRCRFGPRRVYSLWLVLPLALAGSLMPMPRGSGPQRLLEVAGEGFQAVLKTPSVQESLMTVWLAGVGASLMLAALRHAQFLADIRVGHAGPAVIGMIRPRLVTPSGFREQFSPRVQLLIRAHERVHMERNDARWNALTTLLQALFWFNPLIHLAARAMKLDQELACDAVVMDRFPQDRRIYAQALLSAQGSHAASPLGCHWRAARTHSLVTRIGAIANPSNAKHDGLWIVLSLCLWTGAFAAAWASQPPDRTIDRHDVQYIHYSAGATIASRAIWRIAVNPD